MKCSKVNFTIIIPTFNRTNELLYNLKLIDDISSNLGYDIPIIIGDDGSVFEHQKAINNYIKSSNQRIKYYYNEKNMGIEKNELKLVSMVETEYALLLGEDDYLNSSLIRRINWYVNKGEVSVIIPNFYGINQKKEQLRTPRFAVKKDKMIQRGDLKYFCYASQMSGLTFKAKNVCEEYNKKMKSGNSYPQLFFIAYNLLIGNGVHITENPFQNTVLKKKQFDYSVDNLLTDVLYVVNALDLSSKEKKTITKFILKNDVTRYGNAYTWLHPQVLFNKINNYDISIDQWTKNKIKSDFLVSYLKAPLIVARYFFVRRKFSCNKVI